MSLPGGKQPWVRGAALLAVGACAVMGLSSCEYAEDGLGPTATPTRTSRPAPSLPQPTGPDLGSVENKNFDNLEAMLGSPPENVPLQGIGRLSGSGFSKSVKTLAKGRYSVTAACAGAPRAYLSISQAGLTDGGGLDLTLDCGKATPAHVDFAKGPVQVHAFYPATGPATGAVAGFWLVPDTTTS